MNKTKIMVLTGNPVLARMFDGFQEKYSVTSINSSKISLEDVMGKIREMEPDAILLDVEVPSPEGLELALGIRLQCDMPILMLTAFESPEGTIRWFDPKSASMLSEPMNKQMLLSRIDVIASIN
jgi:DNA-binding response OmpR family regulator